MKRRSFLQKMATVTAVSALPSFGAASATVEKLTNEIKGDETMLNRYVIERNIPGVDEMSTHELCGAARASNQALAELSPKIQWEHSYVVKDKTYCIYLSESEELIREHAAKSGMPIARISLVEEVIDPLTANN